MKELKDITVRPSCWEDIETFYRWELRSEVSEFFSIRDGQTYEEVVRRYIEADNAENERQFTICSRESGEMIGRIVLSDIIEGWKMEVLRIYIAEPGDRGKGYGTQAMEWIMDLAFNELDMKRIYLDYYTGNPARYLYEKLGFQHEGCLRDNCGKNGKLYDVHLMSMLAAEYKG